jgi:DNA-binding transcriptional LysR family regulator
VAIRPSLEVPEDLVARRIGGVATALYASPAYAASHKRLAPEGLDWLAPDDSLSHLASARWLRTRIQPDRVRYRASSLIPLQVAARAGMGVAPLPCYLGDRDPGLIRIRAPVSEMDSTLWILMHPDLRRVARIRAFIDNIVPQLNRLRPLLEGRSPQGRPASNSRRSDAR